jgi:hypothetical protein
MGCCGKNRSRLTATMKQTVPRKSATERPSLVAAVPGPGMNPPGTAFQFVGTTGLSVRGPVSGRTYRFAKGSSLVVDERDAPFFMVVPSLRKIAPAS